MYRFTPIPFVYQFYILFTSYLAVESFPEGQVISGNLSLAICNHLDHYNATKHQVHVWAFRVPAKAEEGFYGVPGGAQFVKLPCEIAGGVTDGVVKPYPLPECPPRFDFRQSPVYDRVPVLQEDFGRTIFTVFYAKGDYVHVLYPQLTWYQAVFACGTHLMNLAPVKTAADQKELQELIETSIPNEGQLRPIKNTPRVWTSGFKENAYEGWNWVPDTTLIPEDYFGWNKGQPNTEFWIFCMEMYNYPNASYWGLATNNCDKRQGFICKKRSKTDGPETK